MKRWYYFALAAAAVAGIIYVYAHWGGQGLFASDDASAPGTRMQWRTVARPGDGKERDVPAFNDAGGSEPIHMLVANPNGDVTFAVAWADNPPVARVSQTAERTLNMARDGMLTRTETTILSETRGVDRDYPSLDLLARNSSGGILNARLVMAENRLYLLMALFPTSSARRDKDVERFFNSFVPARPTAIPETMPSASQ